MTRIRPAVAQWSAALIGLALCLPPSLAWAWQSYRSNNRLGVYDIQNYAQQYDATAKAYRSWKSSVPVSNTDMKAQTLYELFNCSDPNTCGYTTSFRLADSNVSVTNMNSSSSSYNFGKPNLLFFYGHNIAPKVYDALYSNYSGHAFDAWFPAGKVSSDPTTTWGPINGQWERPFLCSGYPGDTVGCHRSALDWATTKTPYYYHWTNSQNGQYGIQDASWTGPAYAVFYAYNPLTSTLMGKDWKGGAWPWVNTVGKTTPSYANGPLLSDFFVANG